MNQKRIAQSLVRKFGSRNPFQIADELGIIVIRTPLRGIRGFYQYIKRCRIIYIDSGLNEHLERFVCAHELGHAILHRNHNRIFLDTCTSLTSSRYELEADRFAVDLLYGDDDLREYLEHPIQAAADLMGVSMELAAYRLQSIQTGKGDIYGNQIPSEQENSSRRQTKSKQGQHRSVIRCKGPAIHDQ